MTTRWSPPLPTIGRAGPRIEVLSNSTLLHKLEEYYSDLRSSPDVFERRVSPKHQARALRKRNAPRFLSDMSPGEQQSVLLRNLYIKVSAASRSKMRRELDNNRLHHVRSWFHTANAVVLPLLITGLEEPSFKEVDKLTRWAIENCAHNYSLFQSNLKRLKKQMRKSFALHGNLDHVDVVPTMIPYLDAAKRQYDLMEESYEDITLCSPAALGRYILVWTQTRATGMADQKMIRQSLDKFRETVSQPGNAVTLNPAILRSVVLPAIGADGRHAKVSVGTTSCLESTRAAGGKLGYLKVLTTHCQLHTTYDLRTLEPTSIKPRPVRSSSDLLDWAVQTILERPTYTSCVRVHCVSEPSKARTITVAPLAYQVLMGVFAHVFQPTLRSKHVRSGLKADRHLWRFLQETLNPQNTGWADLTQESEVYALSTDLSEATDWGNKSVARQIWRGLITAAEAPNFPLGLAVLAMNKYCGKRFCFLPDGSNNFELVVSQRGWFMGDMMTKVILTLAHQYCCKLSGLSVYTLVGDDEIALSNSHRQLQCHVEESLPKLFRVSELDTYVSEFFAFYCEEGTIIPQKARESLHVQVKRGEELFYLDYPRIRLLLPQIIETDAYSMTNIGRFALLGKEARWVHSVNPRAAEYFARAGILQHLLVPQDYDTICPFTPIEIGGDGAFPHSAEFMRRVVDDKARDPREVKFRLRALMNNKFVHKFVRSARLDKVVNKHHLFLPKMEGLKALLPPEAIVTPQDGVAKTMLRSIKFDELVDPQSMFFEIAKGLYYQALLQGKDPVQPVFNIDRSYCGGHTAEPAVDYQAFIETWKNPGWRFQSDFGYFILRSEVTRLNPMSLGWDFDKTKQPNAREILNLWVRENVNFQQEALPDVLNMIRTHQPLPKRVVDRLNMFVDSDSYIMHTIDPSMEEAITVTIVTRDQRLGLRVRRYLDNRRPQTTRTVVCLDPAIYLVGRVEEVHKLLPSMVDSPVIEDPGAMLHVDYNEFTDGFPLREDIWDTPIKVFTNRHDIVVAMI